MTERELGKALLNLDAPDWSGLSDPRRQAWTVLDGDRRRVRRWTLVTIVVWLVALVLIVNVLVSFGLLFPKQAKLLEDVQAGKVDAAQRAAIEKEHLLSFAMGTVTIGFSVFVLAIAALCSVFLVLASRRATLRQINASLWEISEQLRRLKPEHAP